MTADAFARGVLVSASLNLLAGGAAFAVVLRSRLAGRAERALGAVMLWNVLVMCPVYALGLTGHLYARTLAWSSAAFFALVYAAARWRTPNAAFARAVGRVALDTVSLPFEAVGRCARARSLTTIGVAFALAMVVWGVCCSYLMPSWKQWDALWYHEPIVGFTIQDHGFAFVDLPQGGAQKINGYPRLGEMTQLWLVIFTDRRFIDVAGWIAAPGLALAGYLLTQRHLRDPVSAAGMASALVLMPATVRVLGSTYVDAQNAAFIVAGAHFATRPSFRVRDAFWTAACLALAVGSKTMALVPAGLLALVAAARLAPQALRRPLAVAAGVVGGGAIIAGSAAAIYLRNWRAFHNPFWPDFKYDNDAWGIHWPGYYEWGKNQFERGEARLDANLPTSDFLHALYRIPYSASMPHTDQMYEYGLGVTWLLVPLTALALVLLVVLAARDVAAHAAPRPSWRAPEGTWAVVALALVCEAIVHFSPALWSARYQIAAVGLALAVVAWAAGPRPRLGEGVAAALSVLGLVSFFWMVPRTWLYWSEARAYAKIPYPEREFTPASAIDPALEIWNGSPVTKETGLAREKQLGPGAVLAFPDGYGVYMALFWNNTFSNRAIWVPAGPDYLRRLMRTDATWAYCQTGDPTCAGLGDPASGWQLVGPLDVEGHGRVFRRTRW